MEKTNISTENAQMEQLKEQFNDRMMKLITIVTVDNFNERMSDAGDSEIVNDMLEAVKDMADTVYKYRRAKSEILSEGPCDCVNDEIDKELERVEKFLRELPSRMEELNYCEDAVKIDNGNFSVLASVDDDGEIYAHLEVSLYGEYEEGDEPIGDSWNWTINDDDDIAKCLNDIRGFFEGPDPAIGYFEKKNA